MKTLIVMMALTIMSMTACNTVEGVGEDISGGAQRVGSWF